MPRAARTFHRSKGEVLTDAPSAQRSEAHRTAFPLLPQERPESSPYPRIKFTQHGQGFAVTEVALPSPVTCSPNS